jgi:hypothetical protein
MAISYRYKMDKLTPEDVLRYVCKEIADNNIKLLALIADSPERVFCKGLNALVGHFS